MKGTIKPEAITDKPNEIIIRLTSRPLKTRNPAITKSIHPINNPKSLIDFLIVNNIFFIILK